MSMSNYKKAVFVSIGIVLGLILMGLIGSCKINGSRGRNSRQRPKMNLAWDGKVLYFPSPTTSIGLAFGVNDTVEQLTDGNLPKTISHVITNTGSEMIPAGYIIRLVIVHWTFLAVSGQAGYVEGDPKVHTMFECIQVGPALAPGQKETITFTLGGLGCPINIPPATVANEIPCGLFQATFTADNGKIVTESDETDNEDKSFFFVPSLVQKINITTVRNPNKDSNIVVIGKIVHPYAPGYSSPTTVTTHQFTVTTIPLGAAFFVNAITPRNGALAGNVGTMTPGPFQRLIQAGTNVSVFNYNVNIVDPSFMGPCTGLFSPLSGNPLSYFEPVNSKLTAISTDGCVIAQKSAQVSVVHECSPP